MSDRESESDGPNERTSMQQEKALNAKKQQKRETGLQTAKSRSRSRRDRRRKIQQGIEDGKYMKTSSLEALEEADANGELDQMQMFERIGPDSTSMDGPVTKARAMRGEIPMRGTDPNQPYRMEPQEKKSSLNDTDGLKLTLEANLEIEIELKASIRGDLTLSLLYVFDFLFLPNVQQPFRADSVLQRIIWSNMQQRMSPFGLPSNLNDSNHGTLYESCCCEFFSPTV